jgi:hypothetical protein
MQRLNLRVSSVLGLCAMALTSACAGDGAVGTDELNFTSTQDARDELVALVDSSTASGFVETTAAQLPTTGSVQYQGFLGIITSDETLTAATDPLFAVGRVELTAGFSGAGTIDGVADHFIDGNNQQMTGQLVIESNIIGKSGSFVAQVDGTITNSAGFEATYDVPMDGSFVGPNVDYISALGSGDFTNNDTGVVTPFEMGLLAQR